MHGVQPLLYCRANPHAVYTRFNSPIDLGCIPGFDMKGSARAPPFGTAVNNVTALACRTACRLSSPCAFYVYLQNGTCQFRGQPMLTGPRGTNDFNPSIDRACIMATPTNSFPDIREYSVVR